MHTPESTQIECLNYELRDIAKDVQIIFYNYMNFIKNAWKLSKIIWTFIDVREYF